MLKCAYVLHITFLGALNPTYNATKIVGKSRISVSASRIAAGSVDPAWAIASAGISLLFGCVSVPDPVRIATTAISPGSQLTLS